MNIKISGLTYPESVSGSQIFTISWQVANWSGEGRSCWTNLENVTLSNSVYFDNRYYNSNQSLQHNWSGSIGSTCDFEVTCGYWDESKWPSEKVESDSEEFQITVE